MRERNVQTNETPATPKKQAHFGGDYAAIAIVNGRSVELHGASAQVLSQFAKQHPNTWQRDRTGWYPSRT